MSEMAAVCCIWECQWHREQAGLVVEHLCSCVINAKRECLEVVMAP